MANGPFAIFSRFTTVDGQPIWINAGHVSWITEGDGGDGAILHLQSTEADRTLVVAESADDVARVLSTPQTRGARFERS
jgi:hypothetical protein